MIYTVGSKKAFLQELMHKGRVMKSGSARGFEGGCAFQTREAAQRHIDELEIQGYKGFMVFGVLADWARDTKPSASNWWHDLTRDAQVVVLEEDEAEQKDARK